MEATQQLDLDVDNLSDENEDPNLTDSDVEVGQLVAQPAEHSPQHYPLHLGVNVIGRQSTNRQRDQDRLTRWKEQYRGKPVHGVFVDSSGVSAAHAAIFVEGDGAFCFVKDLGSRNRTSFIRNAKAVALKGEDRYSLSSGEYIKLGALECRVDFAPVGSSASPARSKPAASCDEEGGATSMQEDAQQPSTSQQVDAEATPELEEHGQDPAIPALQHPAAQPHTIQQTQLLGAPTQLADVAELDQLESLPGDGAMHHQQQPIIQGSHVQARELGDAQGAGSGEDATETSDLDTVWQPQLTAEEGQGPDSQHEVNSPPPGTAVAAPSGGPVNRQPDHQPDAQAEAASPAADFDAAAVREDSDRTVASTPSDLDDGGDDKGAQAGTQAGEATLNSSRKGIQEVGKEAQATSPWRTRQPRRSAKAAASDTQVPDSEAVRASLSQIGHLAAQFPGTQAPGAGPAHSSIVPDSSASDEQLGDPDGAQRPIAAEQQPVTSPQAGLGRAAHAEPEGRKLPAWVLAEQDRAAQPEQARPSSVLKTFDRRGRSQQRPAAGQAQQDNAAAASEHASAAQRQAAVVPDAYAFPESAQAVPDSQPTAAEPPASSMPAAAVRRTRATGRGRGRGRGEKARRQPARGSGKAAGETRGGDAEELPDEQPEGPHPLQETAAEPHAAEGVRAGVEADTSRPALDVQDSKPAISAPAPRSTISGRSFRAGSDTQAAADGLQGLADGSPAQANAATAAASSKPAAQARGRRGGKAVVGARSLMQLQDAHKLSDQAPEGGPAGQQGKSSKQPAQKQARGKGRSRGSKTAENAEDGADNVKDSEEPSQAVHESAPVPASTSEDAGGHSGDQPRGAGRRGTRPGTGRGRRRSPDSEPANDAGSKRGRPRRSSTAAKSSPPPAPSPAGESPAHDHPVPAIKAQRSRGPAQLKGQGQQTLEPPSTAEPPPASADLPPKPAARSKAAKAIASDRKGTSASLRPGPELGKPVATRSTRAGRKDTVQSGSSQKDSQEVPQQGPSSAHDAHRAKSRRLARKVSAQSEQDATPAQAGGVTKAAEEDIHGKAGPAVKGRGRVAKRRKSADAEAEETNAGGGPAGSAAEAAPSQPYKATAKASAVKRKALTQSPEPAQQTTRKLRRVDKPVRVMFSTCVNASLRKSLSKAIQQLGGTVATYGLDFTHFLTLRAARGHTDRGFKKSFNTLLALAAGRPIVVDSWVTASGGAGAWVDAQQHLLEDKAAEEALGFSLSAAHERACHSLLLTDVPVYLTPGLEAAEDSAAEGLKTLVRHAGGTVTTVPPKQKAGRHLILGNEKDPKKEHAWGAKHLPKGLCVHGRSMLVDAILQQALNRHQGILFTV